MFMFLFVLYMSGCMCVRFGNTAFKKEFQKIGSTFTALASSFHYDGRQSTQALTAAVEQTGQAYNDIGEMFGKQVSTHLFISFLSLFISQNNI